MKEYNEFVIKDDVISLYRNKALCENLDITLSQSECFDIVVNDTNQSVGIINYRYNNDPCYIDYGGNINYRIKEEYRGFGYAKRALDLMIEVLKNNTKYDQPLYVASPLYNEDYLRVALECGGTLIHSGPVPSSVINSFYDKEMKNVAVYRIDIQKNKNKTV